VGVVKTRKQIGVPSSVIPKPIKFTGLLSDFDGGQLCFVVARRYRGRGPVKIIMHRAAIDVPDAGFFYGHLGHYVVSAGTLMGSSRSPAKTAAARINGAKGGRPKK
jgi:hypothetical protein